MQAEYNTNEACTASTTAPAPDFSAAAAEIASGGITDMLTAALTYARWGVPVFPCNHSNKNGKGKFPLVKGGFHAATTDTAQIKFWWEMFPAAIIGIPCGGTSGNTSVNTSGNTSVNTSVSTFGNTSGVFMIDIDDHGEAGNGWTTYNERLRGLIPVTLWARTGRGCGCHLYFKYPDNIQLPNSAGLLGAHIDTRGGADANGTGGGYFIAPPSIHPTTGKPYRFQNPGAPLAEMPPELIALCRPAARENQLTAGHYGQSQPQEITDKRLERWYSAVVSGECDQVARQPEGGRNARLFAACIRCGAVAKACGLPVEAAARELSSAAVTAGLKPREVSITLTSAFKMADRNEPAPPPAERPRKRA